MIQLICIVLIPIGIALQGIVENQNRILSNFFQYGPICILAIYSIPRFSLKNGILPKVFVGFFLTSFISLLVQKQPITIEGLRDTAIIATTYLALSGKFRFSWKRFELYAWSLCSSFVALSLFRNGLPKSINFLEGESNWEHHTLGFALPICFLFAIHKSKKLLALICAILSLFAMKRIAILAICGSFCILFTRFSRKIRIFLTFILGTTLFTISNNLDRISLYLKKEVPEIAKFRDFFSGRDSMLAAIKKTLFPSSLNWEVAFGHGPGFASTTAQKLFGAFLKHIHNDYIRIFLDYGIQGTIFWISVFSFLAGKDRFGFALAFYQLVIFTTDNTFVYYPHLVTFYLLIRSLEENQSFVSTQRV